VDRLAEAANNIAREIKRQELHARVLVDFALA
jgi:hypothetical protein